MKSMHFDDPVLQFFTKKAEEKIGFLLGPEKTYLIEARLRAVAIKENFSDWVALLKFLNQNPDSPIHELAYESLATHETMFFRDDFHFNYLIKEIIPKIIHKNKLEKIINIWSAGVSSGQEAYSLSILLHAHFPQLSSWEINIHATDFSNHILEKAISGIYSQIEVSKGLSDQYIDQYFLQTTNQQYQIKDEFKKNIDFYQLNLIGNWPKFPSFDLVLMRNVLIYLSPRKRKDIIKKTFDAMNSTGGYFFMGGSESLLEQNPFETIQLNRGICFFKKPNFSIIS